MKGLGTWHRTLSARTRVSYILTCFLCPHLRRTVSILTDAARSVKSLIDSWAVRFMEEMDYTMEANNADRFATEMAKHTSLGSAIKVPLVYREMTTRYLLVTEWVDGEKASNLEANSPEGRACLATLQVMAVGCCYWYPFASWFNLAAAEESKNIVFGLALRCRNSFCA